MKERSFVGELLMKTFGDSSVPARNTLGKFRIDEISMVDRPANGATAFVKSVSEDQPFADQVACPEGYVKIAEVDGVAIVKPQLGAGQPVRKQAAEAELNVIASQYAAQHGCSIAKAYDAICQTPHGAQLYRETT